MLREACFEIIGILSLREKDNKTVERENKVIKQLVYRLTHIRGLSSAFGYIFLTDKCTLLKTRTNELNYACPSLM